MIGADAIPSERRMSTGTPHVGSCAGGVIAAQGLTNQGPANRSLAAHGPANRSIANRNIAAHGRMMV